MDDLQLRHRNRLRHHYTQTSNVLLFGYKRLSDGAKLTYQVIDSFDWGSREGVRKGYAYPSLARIAESRGVDKRSIRRHLAELEAAGLVTREEQSGRPSLLIIEDPSEAETSAYLRDLGRVGEDKNVRPTPDKYVRPYKENKREENTPVNEEKHVRTEGNGPEALEAILHRHPLQVSKPPRHWRGEQHAKREYLAQQMLAVLGDKHSLGFYRKVATRHGEHAIFEALGQVKELASIGGIRVSRGALFVSLLRDKSKSQTDAISRSSVGYRP